MDAIIEYIKKNVQFVISSILTAFLAIGSFLVWYQAKRTRQNMQFNDFFKEYRAPEMLRAIMRLHAFANKYKDNRTGLKQEYNEIMKRETNLLDGDTITTNKNIMISNTLHYQRRLVSQFYISVYQALKSGQTLKNPTKKWFTDIEILDIILAIGWDDDKTIEALVKIGLRYRKWLECKVTIIFSILVVLSLAVIVLMNQ